MSSSVYKVQCKSFKIAQGITEKPGNVSSYQDAFKPPYSLRIVKQHRTKKHLAFRNDVAKAVNAIRKNKEVKL
ncbi:hypothetical protein BMR05_12620 [Methylococcaceae bacterium HT4]|nr:hypothetical protein BMR05_12620 [Methylococcaceae bacterium HT4]TXL19208.1 hypothetical protein BMR06_11035 [Methylococcaceae bacterium HT5]TXL22063.1 hypothetical protein BMR03_10310 [Methylococcaceae bacterium HT2]